MATHYNEFETHETQHETHEASQWREMHEALHEAHELQREMETPESEGEMTAQRRRHHRTRIVTPSVVIRITLAPMGSGGKIFGSPRGVVGATKRTVNAAPLSGKPYVPIATKSATTGQTVGGGAVYVPKSGGNAVQLSTWAGRGDKALQQASSWIQQQAKQSPALKKRGRKVQVLIDGKPCADCVRQFSQDVSKSLPQNQDIKVRYTHPPAAAAATSTPPRTPQTAAAAPMRTPISHSKSIGLIDSEI